MKDPLQKLLRFESQNIHGVKVINGETHEQWRKLFHKIPFKSRNGEFLNFDQYIVSVEGREEFFYARGKNAHDEIERFVITERGMKPDRITYV